MALEMTPAERNWVEQAVMQQRTYYQERVRVTKHIRKMRALRLETRTPRTFSKLIGKGIRSPLPFTLVQTICGMIAKATPQFTRVPLEPKHREREAALAATFWPLIQTFSAIAHKDLYYLSCDQLAGEGLSVWKLKRGTLSDHPVRLESDSDASFNKRVAEYWNAGGQGRNWLRASLIDPTVFWPDPEDEPSYVVESGRRPLLATLKSLNLRMNGSNLERIPAGETFSPEMLPSGLSFTENVDEIWTPSHVYYGVSGELFKFENEFGFIPYAWRAGMSTSIPDSVLQAVSTVFPFYAMDPHINTLLTAMISNAIMMGMPTATIETQAQAGVLPGEETPPTDIPLGQVMTLQAGKKFSYQQPQSIGSEMVNAVNLFLSFYDRAGVTSAARGMIGTRTPGLTFTAALEAAGDMVQPIQTSLALLLEDVVRMTLKAVDKFDQPIHVTGEHVEPGKGSKEKVRHIIRPSDIKGYYDVHCDLSPQSDQQRQARGMHAAFMKREGLWSKNRAMMYGGVENPEEERREMDLDAIRATPVFMQKQMMAALEDAPEMLQEIADAEAVGEDPLGLGLVAPPVGEGGGAGGGGPIRGASPRAGGRPAGQPRRPTGPGAPGTRLGRQNPGSR